MKKKSLTKDDYVKGILDGNKTILAQAITLIESQKAEHQVLAQEILDEIYPFTGNSKRIGISGTPGVGKSTFIEGFGKYCIEQGSKVAVLAVDPSSHVSQGSILGDKTRMQELASHEKAFIRPSPSRGQLGGIGQKTREAMLLCEAAGFDKILIETVGVGQSEILVASMVDCFFLLLGPSAGDELQGIKRGIMEVADLVIVNKADGPMQELAKVAQHEYQRAVKILRNDESWEPKVLLASALKKTGFAEIYGTLNQFFLRKNEVTQKRQKQKTQWMWDLTFHRLSNYLKNEKLDAKFVEQVEAKVTHSQLTPTRAHELLWQAFLK
ncbi:MAG: methylmalonyl Co-A mutase-associated GTPase MeaB [Bacteriovoracaceae bacterium]|nr:methylmalonyl Co-A mutase-associated GTPase MeaB [Bacteriovoracaceae bacterium]